MKKGMREQEKINSRNEDINKILRNRRQVKKKQGQKKERKKIERRERTRESALERNICEKSNKG